MKEDAKNEKKNKDAVVVALRATTTVSVLESRNDASNVKTTYSNNRTKIKSYEYKKSKFRVTKPKTKLGQSIK